jgi:penicillin-binding protein 1B
MSPPEKVLLFFAELFSSISERVIQLFYYLGFMAQEWGLAERQRRRRAIRHTLLVLSALAVTGFGAYLFSSYKQYAQLIETRLATGRLQSRAGIYAAPRIVHTGQELAQEDLIPMLRRAGYATCDSLAVGCYTQGKQSIVFQSFTDPAGRASEKVEILFAQDRVDGISANGVLYDRFRLDPELLGFEADAQTAPLSYQDLPPDLVKSVLAVEGKDFTAQKGVNWRSALSALWRNIWPGSTPSGNNATITQKIVRNTYLLPERYLSGVFSESVQTVALERLRSREELLALYCDEVYLGQRGVTGVYGMAQGARMFFGKDLKDLTLAESATLAGLAGNPLRYAPDQRPEAALAQRNNVISLLLRDGAVAREQAEAATRAPIALAPYNLPEKAFAPYYASYASRFVGGKLAAAPVPDEASLRVYTALEPDVQAAAEKTLTQHLEQLNQTGKAQGALVALDAKSGQIVALVGGKDFRSSPLNRATDAARAPGATFMPFVYAAALEQGISPLEPVQDSPRAFTYEDAAYAPVNDGNVYANRPVPLRDGLVSSLNVVTTDVSLRLGLDKVVKLANSVGLPQKNFSPALALGVNETTPLALAAAYTAFANGGRYSPPTVIAQALDAHGNPLPVSDTDHSAVISPSTAFIVTHTLEAVMREGAGKPAREAIDEKTALAGKNSYTRDGWFVGYTPSLICAVWLGHDDNTPLAANGGEEALKVWTEFVKEATALRTFGGEEFAKPEEVRLFKVDLDNSQLANGYCDRSAETALLAEQVPAEECRQHNRETLSAKTAEPVKAPSLASAPLLVRGPKGVTLHVPRPQVSDSETVAPPKTTATANPAPASGPITQATPKRPVTPPLILAPPVLNTRPGAKPPTTTPVRRIAAKETPPRGFN